MHRLDSQKLITAQSLFLRKNVVIYNIRIYWKIYLHADAHNELSLSLGVLASTTDAVAG